MTRILHISDGHGYLPKADASLAVDLVCITGDDSADYMGNLDRQLTFAYAALEPALAEWGVPVIGTPGNHNQLAGQLYGLRMLREIFAATGGAYLVDEGVEIDGLNFYGSPWTAPTNHSVFIAPEIELAQKWTGIPEALDVLLTHGPPAGWCDRGYGSPSLREHVSWARPRVHLFGHVHSARGVDGSPATLFSNGAIVDGAMQPCDQVTVIVLGPDGSADYEIHPATMVDYLHVA
jgi:Icc-related predicted phosphoesterase